VNARMRSIGGYIAASAISTLLTQPAFATSDNVRLRHDGCEVGGGGNDIQSVRTRYNRQKDEVVVTLKLCDKADPDTTYRLHVDHAAPFVEEPEANAACVSPAESVLTHAPGGHRGPGRSIVFGTRVRFFVPLAELGVGPASEVPMVHLWATSTRDGVIDRAPHRETGDGCAHPRARTETLAQVRVVLGHLIWVTKPFEEGFIDGILDADDACRMDAESTGHSGTFVSWFTDQGISPSMRIFGNVGYFTRLDGTVVATGISDLANCTKGASGTDCLLAPINLDIHGNPVAAGTMTWTGTQANGTGSTGPTCNGWNSFSPADSGSGGAVDQLGTGWTDGVTGPCNQLRSLICLEIVGEG